MTDIPLPDHPIRKHWAWQAFDRLWRPTAGWVTVFGVAYAAGIGHVIGKPMNEGYLAIWLAFAAAVIGIKSWEKLKGIS